MFIHSYFILAKPPEVMWAGHNAVHLHLRDVRGSVECILTFIIPKHHHPTNYTLPHSIALTTVKVQVKTSETVNMTLFFIVVKPLSLLSSCQV